MAKRGLLERLSEGGHVLGDGGYIVELEKRGFVKAGPFTPEVVLDHPEAVKELHREFLYAGADVLQAMAFYGSGNKLNTVGYGDRTEEVNRDAVRLAHQAIADSSLWQGREEPLVAGELSATWLYARDKAAKERVGGLFRQQLKAQVEEGVDFVIGELFFHVGEALVALECIQETGLPSMITMTFDHTRVSRDGKTPAQCSKILEDAGADIVGFNCSLSPSDTLEIVEEMRRAVKCYVAAQPAGFRGTKDMSYIGALPAFPYAMEPYQLTRGDLADFARKAKDIGIEYIGGCCGTIATHIREMARVLGKLPPEKPYWNPNYERPQSVTEGYKRLRETAKPEG